MKKNENEISIHDDQLHIIESLKEGKNIIVDSIAGSGKSTTIMILAQKLPQKHFLQITYNSMLRKEFKEKIKSNGVSNIEVHTYHSFAVKYFSSKAYNDTGLKDILLSNEHPIDELPKYDIFVLDECQDMSKLYFQFIQYTFQFLKTQYILKLLNFGNKYSDQSNELDLELNNENPDVFA